MSTTASNSTAHFAIPGKPKVMPLVVTEARTPPVAKPQSGPNKSSEQGNMLPLVREKHLPTQAIQVVAEVGPLPFNLHRTSVLNKDELGNAYVIPKGIGNPVAFRLGSKRANALIAECARGDGVMLRPKELLEINQILEAHAEHYAKTINVWYRVAKVDGGIELDVGDEANTRIRITAGDVEVLMSESEVVFTRNPNMKPLAMPVGDICDLDLLNKYLNVSAPDQQLLLAWITYVLAHPKGCGSKYVFLVLSGNEGSGKSNLSKLLLKLIDPSAVGVQAFPSNAKDFAIAGQHAHLLAYDNLRSFKDHMADMLCVASTGGSITSRKLYSDTDQQAIPLHVALILNGIHNFIEQPDLAQRCLPIHLSPIEPAKRKPEEVMNAELEADLPKIMRGLFELIAKVFQELPEVVVSNPERMIEFSRWLAAMERADGMRSGSYQELYSFAICQGQLDTLMDNPLAAAIINFSDEMDKSTWSGTPTELHRELNRIVGLSTQRSREWPQNPIALSRRISGLQAGLRSQGIRIELTRGKKRMVTISKVEG